MEKLKRGLGDNEQRLYELLKGDMCLRRRRIVCSGTPCVLFFSDGMASRDSVANDIIRPLVSFDCRGPVGPSLLAERGVFSGEAKLSDDMDELCRGVMSGDAVLFCGDSPRALILGARGFTSRPPSEPDGEKVSKGPREGFCEVMTENLAMIRRRLKTNELRFEALRFGTVSGTDACLCWIEGVCDEGVLREVRRRLERVSFDGIIDSNCISEQIADARYSPFRTVGTTERPDVVAAKLLEGRCAVVTDGTPVALTLPHILIEELQAAEEYYVGYFFASVSRVLKVMGLFLSVSVAPLYMAILNFHPEMLPTSLLFSLSAARRGVPFPLAVEMFLLLGVFDILRETGIRTTSSVGQTLSIVGALVLGQAAVTARFVSAPSVIIIAFTGVTGLLISKMQGAVVPVRVGLLILASVMGVYGYVFGMIALLCHLASLRSCGVPYLGGSVGRAAPNREDSIIRAPFFSMKKRGRFLGGKG